MGTIVAANRLLLRTGSMTIGRTITLLFAVIVFVRICSIRALEAVFRPLLSPHIRGDMTTLYEYVRSQIYRMTIIIRIARSPVEEVEEKKKARVLNCI